MKKSTTTSLFLAGLFSVPVQAVTYYSTSGDGYDAAIVLYDGGSVLNGGLSFQSGQVQPSGNPPQLNPQLSSTEEFVYSQTQTIARVGGGVNAHSDSWLDYRVDFFDLATKTAATGTIDIAFEYNLYVEQLCRPRCQPGYTGGAYSSVEVFAYDTVNDTDMLIFSDSIFTNNGFYLKSKTANFSFDTSFEFWVSLTATTNAAAGNFEGETYLPNASSVAYADPLISIGTNGVTASKNLPSTTLSAELISPVPVPSAVWLFGSSLIGLTVIKRKK